MQQDRTASIPMAPHPVDNVHPVHCPNQPSEVLPRSVLAGFARRISNTPDRVFTSGQLLLTLTMSARLTHDCSAANNAAYETWSENRHGSWHTREAREQAMRNAHDFADYVWAEATADAERVHGLLFTGPDTTVSAADLLKRIDALTDAVGVAA
ncbi:hypothetical protein ABZ383_30435 [Streptomyces sp. NPDC005900]|uniref:hypothetical protein n=1 Tax=Streptomyces sp. NPDC005900 TaxID=3154569 RepID=UPI0033E07374